jgi:hypothetical protein
MIVDDECDDELIFETDIYLAGKLLKSHLGELINELYVFQYPLRPSERNYGDEGELTSMTINKSEEDKIKLNYTVDTRSKNFDSTNVENRV